MGLAIIIPGVSYADANLGKVTITGNRPIEALAIIGQNNVVSQAQFSVRMYPYNTTDRGVIWSIDSGGAYATINPTTGELFAIDGADENTVVIRATSSANNSIYATKTLSVSYIEHTIIPLSYIAADGGKYIDVPIILSGTTSIKCDFKIANITINDTTDRQYAYSDGSYVGASYSKRWGTFGISYPNAMGKLLTSFYDRGLIESSASGHTLFDKDTNSYVTLRDSSISANTFTSKLYLFNALNPGHTYKKVLVYSFSVSNSGVDIINLSPVLYDGVPCYYDSVSRIYIQFSGETGNIWYATAEAPNNEILYTE